MKSKVVLTIVFVCLFAGSGLDAANTEIRYDEPTNLGGGRWEYTYTVYNLSLGVDVDIEEFTIWFDFGVYDNLLVTTPLTPAGWNQIVWDPEPVLEDDGAYDALALTVGIGQDESVSDFSVSFDWLPGTGQPGSQFYEIVIPNTSPVVVIDSGWTIPEPGTLLLIGFGSVLLLRKCTETGG